MEDDGRGECNLGGIHPSTFFFYSTRLPRSVFRALGKIAEFIELDDNRFITAFQSMVPNMVGVLQQALEKSDEDAALKGFEVFDELLYLVR